MGARTEDVAVRLRVCDATVRKWHRRFVTKRVDGLRDEPRPGAPRTITDDKVEAVIVKTLDSAPEDATHWSSRGMAEASGVSVSSVQRIWRAFGLRPHRSETFKLSTDPLFIEKVRDVVGLYVAPPEHAIVLCVDEKSQIQALDRSQPLLPMRPGQPERRPHDYTRHGITSLFAALDIATGRIIGKCYPRHRSSEFRRFLDQVEAATPQWSGCPRRHGQLCDPQNPSHPQMVLQATELRRGVYLSVTELETSINSFIDHHNRAPKPFLWTKNADDILAAIKRFCTRTLAVQNAANF
jgi:transposase